MGRKKILLHVANLSKFFRRRKVRTKINIGGNQCCSTSNISSMLKLRKQDVGNNDMIIVRISTCVSCSSRKQEPKTRNGNGSGGGAGRGRVVAGKYIEIKYIIVILSRVHLI